jgi:hypothetical protein
MGDNNHVVFGNKKIPCEKGSVRQHCRDATASSFVANVWGKAFAQFHSCHKMSQ